MKNLYIFQLIGSAVVYGKSDTDRFNLNELKLPSYLHQLASDVTYIKEAYVPTDITTNGKVLKITSHYKDDTIPRLKTEFIDLVSVYKLKQLYHKKNSYILDIGGNVGFIAIAIHKLFPTAKIITFEPNPKTYFYLRVNMWMNKATQLTSEELTGNSTLGGIYPIFGGLGIAYPMSYISITPGDQSQNTITDLNIPGNVPVYNLKYILNKHNLLDTNINVMKIDCECCEYSIIHQNADWLRQRVNKLTGEIHGCKSQHENKTLNTLKKIFQCKFPPKNFNSIGQFIETANLAYYCDNNIF
jgi:FkbM family methyltransferase